MGEERLFPASSLPSPAGPSSAAVVNKNYARIIEITFDATQKQLKFRGEKQRNQNLECSQNPSSGLTESDSCSA